MNQNRMYRQGQQSLPQVKIQIPDKDVVCPLDPQADLPTILRGLETGINLQDLNDQDELLAIISSLIYEEEVTARARFLEGAMLRDLLNHTGCRQFDPAWIEKNVAKFRDRLEIPYVSRSGRFYITKVYYPKMVGASPRKESWIYSFKYIENPKVRAANKLEETRVFEELNALQVRKFAYDSLLQLRKEQPSKVIPDTLGMRLWVFDRELGQLYSPYRGTPWNGLSLVVPRWTQNDKVENTPGIHARRVPRDWKDWVCGYILRGTWATNVLTMGNFDTRTCCLVGGIVERHGRYVLGTRGWRTERAEVKELATTSRRVKRALNRFYPDLKVTLL